MRSVGRNTSPMETGNLDDKFNTSDYVPHSTVSNEESSLENFQEMFSRESSTTQLCVIRREGFYISSGKKRSEELDCS